MSPEERATVENAVNDYLESDMLDSARYHWEWTMFLQHLRIIPPLLQDHPARIGAAANHQWRQEGASSNHVFE